MNMRMSSLIFAAAALFALGVASGGWWARRASPKPLAAAKAPDADARWRVPTGPLVDEAVIRLELRRALHEELQRMAPAGVDAVPEAASKPAVSSEQVRAFTEASALIDHAKAGAGWNREDAQAFHRLIPKLAPEQRTEALSKLAVAINRQELKVHFVGPPF